MCPAATYQDCLVHFWQLCAHSLLRGLIHMLACAQAVIGFVTDGTKRQSKQASFSRDELRRLFDVNTRTDCDTRDMLFATDPSMAASWSDISMSTDDVVLQGAVQTGSISYVQLQMVRGLQDSKPLEVASATIAPYEACELICEASAGDKRVKVDNDTGADQALADVTNLEDPCCSESEDEGSDELAALADALDDSDNPDVHEQDGVDCLHISP
jgi:hypothetical protein